MQLFFLLYFKRNVRQDAKVKPHSGIDTEDKKNSTIKTAFQQAEEKRIIEIVRALV